MLDIALQKMLRTRNEELKFQRGHINFSRVKDPAEIDLAVSVTPLRSFQGGGGSMTPRKSIEN
jgi:hypothetical protein